MSLVNEKVFLRKALEHAYDRKDWETMLRMSRLLDEIALGKAQAEIAACQNAG